MNIAEQIKESVNKQRKSEQLLKIQDDALGDYFTKEAHATHAKVPPPHLDEEDDDYDYDDALSLLPRNNGSASKRARIVSPLHAHTVASMEAAAATAVASSKLMPPPAAAAAAKAAPLPLVAAATTASKPRTKFKKLKDASYYKRKMLAEMTMRRNMSYIADLVDAVAENIGGGGSGGGASLEMSVRVPIEIISDDKTVEELLRLNFKLNPNLIDSVCYCGAAAGECAAVKRGMPTDTCVPPVCEVSWANAELVE